MKTVELHHMYSWDCDECGRENYTRVVLPNLGPDEMEYLKIHHKIDKNTNDQAIIISPDIVECKYCRVRFKAKAQSNL